MSPPRPGGRCRSGCPPRRRHRRRTAGSPTTTAAQRPEPLAPGGPRRLQGQQGRRRPVTSRVFVAAMTRSTSSIPTVALSRASPTVPGRRGALTSGLGAPCGDDARVGLARPPRSRRPDVDHLPGRHTNQRFRRRDRQRSGFTSTNYLNAQLMRASTRDPRSRPSSAPTRLADASRRSCVRRRGLFLRPGAGRPVRHADEGEPTSVSFEQTNSNVTVNTDLLRDRSGDGGHQSGQEFSLRTPNRRAWCTRRRSDRLRHRRRRPARDGGPSVNRVRVFRDGSLATLVDFTMADAIVPPGSAARSRRQPFPALTSVSAESVGLVVPRPAGPRARPGAVTGGRSGAPIPGARVVALRRGTYATVGPPRPTERDGTTSASIRATTSSAFRFHGCSRTGLFAGAPTAVSVGQGGPRPPTSCSSRHSAPHRQRHRRRHG